MAARPGARPRRPPGRGSLGPRSGLGPGPRASRSARPGRHGSAQGTRRRPPVPVPAPGARVWCAPAPPAPAQSRWSGTAEAAQDVGPECRDELFGRFHLQDDLVARPGAVCTDTAQNALRARSNPGVAHHDRPPVPPHLDDPARGGMLRRAAENIGKRRRSSRANGEHRPHCYCRGCGEGLASKRVQGLPVPTIAVDTTPVIRRAAPVTPLALVPRAARLADGEHSVSKVIPTQNRLALTKGQ